MRDFTPEEKELIINTPIDIDCFGDTSVLPKPFFDYINFLDRFRKEVASCKGEVRELGFLDLVDMLPNSYKVVKL